MAFAQIKNFVVQKTAAILFDQSSQDQFNQKNTMWGPNRVGLNCLAHFPLLSLMLFERLYAILKMSEKRIHLFRGLQTAF